MNRFSQFIKFLFCGFIAALVNWISRLLFNDFMFINLSLSIIFAHVLGMLIAFLLFRIVVFKSNKNILQSISSFTIVNLLSLILIFFMTILFINLLSFSDLDNLYIKAISHAIAVSFTSITSYVLHKKFTY